MTTPTNRRSGRAAALLATIFIAGSASGYMTASRVSAGEVVVQPATVSIRAQLHQGLPAAFDSLDLTTEQRQDVLEILARARPKTEAALHELIPRLRALTDSVDAEIRTVLRPEQRARLATLRVPTQPSIVVKRGSPGRSTRVDTLFRSPSR